MELGQTLWNVRLLALKRFVAAALAISFALAPVSTALAQEAGTDTVATDTGATTQTADPTTPPPALSIPGVDSISSNAESDSAASSAGSGSQVASPTDAKSTETTDSSQTTNASTQSLSSSFGGGDPTSPEPSLFTLQNTRPKADGQSGALIQNIAIDVPPGRNGLQPDLSLQYNSQRTEDSIVGYGWTVTIPYIKRLNKTGSQDLYNTQYFTSSIDGELATTSTTTTAFGAKVDDGHFNAYSFVNNVWTMYDKSGTRYTFGASDNAQQNASASSTKIYTWMLQEIRDTNNNYVRYVYAKDSGQIYPLKILYTGNGSTDGVFTVTFATSTRSDAYTNYLPGFKATTNHRISQITAAVNGNVVREYNLSYTTGNNGNRSLLSSVQENGYDANHQNQVSYPAITFGYISSTTAFVWPVAGLGSGAASGHVIADVNGNSINDVTAFVSNGGAPPTLTGTVWQEGNTNSAASVTPPEFWSDTQSGCDAPRPDERGTRFVDVNADGKADVVQSIMVASSTQQLFLNAYSTSTGYSWVAQASTSWNGVLPAFASFNTDSTRTTLGIFGDVNGDGLPDFEQRVDPVSTGAYLGNGSAWTSASSTNFSPALAMPWPTPTGYNSQLVDINSDGLDDWVSSQNGITQVQLNNGTGWDSGPDHTWDLGTTTLYQSPDDATTFYDRGIRFVDINGDGLIDVVRSYQMTQPANNLAPRAEVGTLNWVFLNAGTGWATSTLYTFPTPISQPQVVGGAWSGVVCHNEYANFTGNGQNAQDVLSSITYPQGGTTTIAYSKTAQQGTNNNELPVSLLTVSSITTSDGLGTTYRKDYTYSGGQMYLSQGVRNRKFGGFLTVTETDPNTITKTYYDQGNSVSTSVGEQSDGYGQINHPFRIDVQSAANNQLVKQTFSRWDATSTFVGNTTFVNLARQVTQDYDSAGVTHRDTATDYAYSTSTGNVTTITRYGEVTGNSDGTFSDTGSDKSTETFLYAVSTTTQATGLPYDDTVVDQSSNKVRETRHTYDGLSLGSLTKGNETKTENWISSLDLRLQYQGI